ncbi:hypothetical protein D3C81_2110940 [compost metagenome]
MSKVAAGHFVTVCGKLGERAGDSAAHVVGGGKADNQRSESNGHTGPYNAIDFILNKTYIVTHTNNHGASGNANIRCFMYTVTIVVCIAEPCFSFGGLLHS